MVESNAPALTPLIFLFGAVIIPLLGWKWQRSAYPLALASTLAAAGVSAGNLFNALASGAIHYRFGGWAAPIGIEYILDPLSGFMAAVVNGISLVVMIHAGANAAREIRPHKRVPYWALVMLMLCGYNGIIMTGDFFNLYVFLEISSLALYGLIAAGDRKSPVAAFRYLIMGTMGGSFYLLGNGFLYFTTGSLNMLDVKSIVPELGAQPGILAGLAFMVIGFGIKMAMFPLHLWLPDAYTHAPSPTSSLMAPVGIKIGAYGLIRVLFFVFGLTFITRIFPVTEIVSWLSAAGIVYGSILAMSQTELKRMLAYSSVSQIGYVGLGIGLANPMGMAGALLHVLNHGLMKACLFLVAGNFRTKLGHSNIAKFDFNVRRRMPWTTAAFTVGAMAMIGIPPTVGFFSKWYLALGTIADKKWFFLGVILLSSLLNAVYFFRVIEKIYLTPAAESGQDSGHKDVGAAMLVPTLIFAASLILIGLLNAVVVNHVIMTIISPEIWP